MALAENGDFLPEHDLQLIHVLAGSGS